MPGCLDCWGFESSTPCKHFEYLLQQRLLSGSPKPDYYLESLEFLSTLYCFIHNDRTSTRTFRDHVGGNVTFVVSLFLLLLLLSLLLLLV